MTTILSFCVGLLGGFIIGFMVGANNGICAERKDWELLTNNTKDTINKKGD